MDLIQILVNIGYVFMLAALTVRDILWLRGLLVSAQLSLFTYGMISGNIPVAFWNALFFIINSYQVVRLIQQRRPIDLPDDLIDLYEKIFLSMRRREFLYFWQMGEIHKVKHKRLIGKGEHQKNLLLILSGEVEIKKSGKLIAKLSRGSFVAEMSFLTGEPATADVFVPAIASYISWDQQKLHSLEQLNPDLLIKIQHILGKDLTTKLKKDSEIVEER
ncbi:MAG: cyclic nucleotide-binding domain-containing protein [Calditrichaceae bacterium]|nr:cyclic nucleotide-binding domain-containing protein [Calditrichaceae bacterium]